MSWSEILAVMQRKHLVNWSKVIRSLAKIRSRDKLCRFHEDHSYDIEDCVQLKRKIKRLLKERHLKEYVWVNKPRRDKEKEIVREKTPACATNTLQERTKGVINMIIRGESVGKESLGKRKAYAYQVYLVSISRHPQYNPSTFIVKVGKGVRYL